MEIEDQVCSFEQARKLAELKIWDNSKLKFPTYFIWAQYKGDAPQVSLKTKDPKTHYIVPAPTVAELGLLLHQSGYECYYCDTRIYKQKYGEFWFDLMDIWNDGVSEVNEPISAINQAHARADALIWLIDKKILKVEDLKL